jgi:hypothetical protein
MKLLIVIACTAIFANGTAFSQPSPTPLQKVDQEQVAISKIRKALAKAEASFTAENLADALQVTLENGGFDNEAVVDPWFGFLEKHTTRVFVLSDGKTKKGRGMNELFMVTSYCLESGLEIKDHAKAAIFKEKVEQLGQLLED